MNLGMHSRGQLVSACPPPVFGGGATDFAFECFVKGGFIEKAGFVCNIQDIQGLSLGQQGFGVSNPVPVYEFVEITVCSRIDGGGQVTPGDSHLRRQIR